MQLHLSLITLFVLYGTTFCSDSLRIKWRKDVDSSVVSIFLPIPTELVKKIFECCDKKSQLALSAVNKRLHEVIVFKIRNLDIDLKTCDLRSVPWVYNQIWNGYIWLMDVEPFNKELADDKTKCTGSLLASKKLKISGRTHVKNYTQLAWNFFANRAGGVHQIEHLYLDGVRLPDTMSFFENLRTNSTITYLTLENIEFQNSTMSASSLLSDVLMHNTTLKKLCLCYNIMSEADGLFMSLKKNSTLTAVEWGCQYIGATDVSRLFDVFDRNTMLTKFKMWDRADSSLGRVGEDEVDAVPRMLKTNTTLTDLSLCLRNLGTTRQLRLFADALAVNTTLQQLDLCGLAMMYDEGVEALAKVLKTNTTLMALSLKSLNRLNLFWTADLSNLIYEKPDYNVLYCPILCSLRVIHKSDPFAFLAVPDTPNQS